MDKKKVIELIISQSEKLKSFGVKRIGLFGSYVRNQAGPDSDIDLVVEFEPSQKTYDNFINLAYYLEELLEHRVDLLTNKSISPYLKSYIQEELEDVPIAS